MSVQQSSILGAKQPGAYRSVIYAGLIAGFLDVLAAVILFANKSGNNPIIIFNYIASGLIGPTAFKGGLPIVLLGLLLHFLIAFAFALLFFMIYPQVKRLIMNPLLSGFFYGIFVWFMMNFVILRLSRIPNMPLNIVDFFTELLVLIVFLGIPISLTIGKHYKEVL